MGIVAVRLLYRLCCSQVLSMVVNSLSFLCLDHIISNIGRVDILTRKSLYLFQKRQDSEDLNLAKYKLKRSKNKEAKTSLHLELHIVYTKSVNKQLGRKKPNLNPLQLHP